MPDLFIIHSSKNNKLAKKVNDHLIGQGIDTWIDFVNIPPGLPWDLEVDKAMAVVRCGLLLMSRESVNSLECRNEWNKILDMKRRLFIAKIGSIPRREIPTRLNSLQYVEIEGRKFDENIGRLVEAIQVVCGREKPGAGIVAAITDFLTLTAPTPELKRVRVTLVRSPIGYHEDQQATVKALGLRKLHQSQIHVLTPSIQGMLHKVRHLILVEDIDH